ncbi:S41 family peptidase [Spartinivicinus ruber]|uniref:S41 family peptidase n=1 Tax=Spartinivicinus ruber TaxID=2683272 RepID=UPI0013D87274|nr:S41 family peptidase [Spartinivicinus ruber]
MISKRLKFSPSVRHLAFAVTALVSSLAFAEVDSDQPLKGRLPLEELRTFAEVFDRIKVAYVENVDDKTLLENAIKGMLTGLDPHSAYLDPKDFEDLQINTTGEFGGLGIEVGMENGFVKVITPIDDTPAERAGIEAGDLIIKLDQKPVKGMSLNEAVDMMRGKPGEPITLTIVREGSSKPFDIVVKRDIIKVQSVKSKALDDGYGYIRITQFQIDSGSEVVSAIKKLGKANKGHLNGLILDLRNNPGGVLQAAVDVSDAFLKKGVIVYTKGRIPNSELRFKADEKDPSNGIPVVVLINSGSASASEIVAGALQDHKRAIIMGTDSFGKGSVQTVLPLNNERALKLTTALYYTPNGRSIQAQGIVPDIVVERAKVTKLDQGLTYKEADLQGHLGNGNGLEDKPSSKKAKKVDKQLEDDHQLQQALSLLKGLSIAKKAVK